MSIASRRQHNLRRRGALSLAVALGTAMTFTACGSSSHSNTAGKSGSSGGVTDITLWQQDTGTSLQALNTVVSGFNSSQNKYHVTSQYIAPDGTSETAFTAKLATALTSHSGPQLTWSDSEPAYVPELVNTGDVVNLQSFMNSQTDGLPASAFNAAMLDTGTFNGKIYALPCDGGDYAIMYNKKLFKQAGITSTPKTWAQLTTDAQKLTKNGVYGFYVPFGTQEWTVWTYESMLWSEGGQFLNANNTKAEFDSPQGVAALNVWLNLIHTHLSYPSDLATSTQSSGYPGFQDSKVAMYIDGSYDLPTDDKALGQSNVGVFAFPATQQYAMNTGTNMAVMLKGTKVQEAASWAFIKYALSPDVQAKYDITAGFLPTVKATGDTPAFKAYLKTDPRLAVFLDELDHAHTRPSIKAYQAISTDLGLQLESAFLGKTSAAQALKTAAAQANKTLSSAS
jgi:multiple sugar transport system substrate-binding protein